MTFPEHPLQEYLNKKTCTVKAFCRKNKLCYQSVISYMTGRRLPSYQMIVKITEATKFEVNPIDIAIWSLVWYFKNRQDNHPPD